MRAALVLATLALLGLAIPVAAAAPLPSGCTFLPAAYHCVVESDEPCGAYTAAGAGASGLAGVAVGGYDACTYGWLVAGASVGVTYVTLTWSGSSEACAMVVSSSATTASAPCVAGSPPNPGWGALLP